MKFSPRQIGIALGGVVLIGIVLFLVFSNLRSSSRPPDITLTIWGPFDDRAAFEAVFQGYRFLHPNVTMAYEQVDPEDYESRILQALATGRGPDIFMVRSRSVGNEAAKLVAADPLQVPLARLRELFPAVVEQDFAVGDRIYGLPLFSDTLALFYNRTAFDRAGLVAAPRTWTEFRSLIPYLASVNENRQIDRAAAAIGGSSRTIPAAADLLSLIMMQNGAPMNSTDGTSATFNSEEGIEALNFYLQFVSPTSPSYTWSDSQGRDRDAFSSGKAAMMFGYARDVAALKESNPFLDMGVASVPQIAADKAVSYADYWGLGVSRQSQYPTEAWEFVAFAATDANATNAYLAETKRAPILRTAIGKKLADPNIGVFVRQALTARSWRMGEPATAAAAFDEAIRSVAGGAVEPAKALGTAQERIDRSLRTGL